jgi:hypothetical protein
LRERQTDRQREREREREIERERETSHGVETGDVNTSPSSTPIGLALPDTQLIDIPNVYRILG